MKAFFILLLIPFSLAAQESTPTKAAERPPFTLKLAPLDLINPISASIDLLADLPLTKRWVLELGADWIADSPAMAMYETEKFQGFAIKPALKYYFHRSGYNHNYLALAFKYKNVYHDRFTEILRQGGQYLEWALLRKQRVTWGASLRTGSQFYFGPQERMVIDIGAALGIRQLKVSRPNAPADATFPQGIRLFNFDRVPGIYTTADFMFVLNVGFVLSKKK